MKTINWRALPFVSIILFGLLINACAPYGGAMHNQGG